MDNPKKIPSPDCAYHRHYGWYNHAGYLPCGECVACEDDRASLARLKKWNADTDAGAKPNR